MSQVQPSLPLTRRDPDWEYRVLCPDGEWVFGSAVHTYDEKQAEWARRSADWSHAPERKRYKVCVEPHYIERRHISTWERAPEPSHPLPESGSQ